MVGAGSRFREFTRWPWNCSCNSDIGRIIRSIRTERSVRFPNQPLAPHPLRSDRHEVSVALSAESRPLAAKLSKTRLDLIEAAGRLCQMVGMPRSTGQIYGLLYLSPRAVTLDEIADLLEISKASASTGTRQLLAVHAIRQVWKPGDRKDYFESVPELREVLRSIYQSFFRPKLSKSRGRIDLLLETLEQEKKSGVIDREEYQFCRERLVQMSSLQGKVEKVLPLAEKFL